MSIVRQNRCHGCCALFIPANLSQQIPLTRKIFICINPRYFRYLRWLILKVANFTPFFCMLFQRENKAAKKLTPVNSPGKSKISKLFTRYNLCFQGSRKFLMGVVCRMKIAHKQKPSLYSQFERALNCLQIQFFMYHKHSSVFPNISNINQPILIKPNSIDYLCDSNTIEVSHSTKK